MVGPDTFITCPACGRGGTIHTCTMSSGSVSVVGSCPKCSKMVRLVVQNGKLVEVKLS